MKVAFFVAEDFNLGAAYLIAYLKSIGNEVRLFFDSRLGNVDFFPQVKEYNPDLICFSCVTANFGWALHLAKTFQMLNKRVLFGGVHPTLCPEDFEGFDVCVGSGEEYFGGKFEPDNLWADREIFFEQLPPVHRAYQIFMTGFGCPFRCSYCNNHQLHKKLIRRSVEGCIEELKYLKEGGLKYVLFEDDIFTLNYDWLRDFLNSYRHSIKLPFTCFAHPCFMGGEIAELLAESNCQCVWMGVQTGHEETRRNILNRPETNEEIRTACETIKKARLKLMIDHIFGLPFDNFNKLLQSFEFYKSLRPDVVNCYELLYFPKAEINKYVYVDSSRDTTHHPSYQKEGGRDYKKYAKSFTSIPLMGHKGISLYSC